MSEFIKYRQGSSRAGWPLVWAVLRLLLSCARSEDGSSPAVSSFPPAPLYPKSDTPHTPAAALGKWGQKHFKVSGKCLGKEMEEQWELK